ncbi:protein MENT isoform X2 [Lethenteron reissneri]|uniref:protein MENT isoform X2 n=1 Tax=Lethenteron reissneri TaxID=7753 RepID=UPI002AB6BE7D|nr:protein MENT isoform X2 [Lethenteron reissneri]
MERPGRGSTPAPGGVPGAGGTPPLRLSAWGPWQCHCEAGTQARWRHVLRAQVTRPARPPQLVQEAACNLQQCTRCTARDCRLLPHKRAVGF